MGVALALGVCGAAVLWTMERQLKVELGVDAPRQSAETSQPPVKFATLREALAAGEIEVPKHRSVGERISLCITSKDDSPLRVLRGEIFPSESVEWMVVNDVLLFPNLRDQTVVCDCLEKFEHPSFGERLARVAEKRISEMRWRDVAVAQMGSLKSSCKKSRVGTVLDSYSSPFKREKDSHKVENERNFHFPSIQSCCVSVISSESEFSRDYGGYEPLIKAYFEILEALVSGRLPK